MKRGELSVNKQQHEKPNRHVKGTYRQFKHYFLDNFLPRGTSIIFVDCLWDNSSKRLHFKPPNFVFFSEILLLLCYILKNGAEDSTISFHSEFYFLLKTAYSARPTCVNLKTEFVLWSCCFCRFLTSVFFS